MKITAIGLATAIALTSGVAFARSGTQPGPNRLRAHPPPHFPSFHADRTCKVVKEDGDEAYKDCLSDGT